MTDEEKLKIFEYFLNKIETKSIREFTKFCILNLPEYFWSLPASTTGINHGKGETLLDHVFACLYVAEQVCDSQFKDHWTQRQKDQLYSALILHDGWRCGEPGNECRITQEMINEKGLDQSLLGALKTTRDHPDIGYRQLILLSCKYNGSTTDKISLDNLNPIVRAVRFHYGPFTKYDDNVSYSLSWPYDTVVVQCHNIDFHQTMNNMYFTRGNIKHTEIK